MGLHFVITQNNLPWSFSISENR